MVSVKTADELRKIGYTLGQKCLGGEVFELIGDVGSGKTTLCKGLGDGLDVDDDVQSPSFTISRVYPARDGLELDHYDFYRLPDPGIMSFELSESLSNPRAITVVEWAETVNDVLGDDRIRIHISYQPDTEGRLLKLEVPDKFNYISLIGKD